MTDTTETTDEAAPVRFMPQLISLDYTLRVNPTAIAFTDALVNGRITGHRCPRCSLVYVPPRGFCPICVVPTGPDDEVEIADRGIVTSWTVLTPIQYAGQKERVDYALASVLLDGADGTVGQQRLLDVALDEIRPGMWVEAVWAPPEARDAGERGHGFGAAIEGWQPTGAPDAPKSAYQDHTL